MQHFVPENEAALLGGGLPGDVLLELAVEVDLQVAVVLRTDLLQQLLAVGVLFPLVRGALVAA